MKTENDFLNQATLITGALPPKVLDIVKAYHLAGIISSFISQELFKAYQQGIQDETERILNA